MDVRKTTITVGILLILQGAGFYAASDSKSLTALIPAFFGLPIALLGLAALRPSIHKHAIHGAVLLALFGLLAPLGRIASAGLRFSAAGVSQLLMIVLCAVLVVLGLKSFVDARRRRKAAP
ncbi:MAG: hypothetical protein PHO07_07045 [Pirellulales bacterium]|jgi:hypothetical protein|nr:hypothetical protein [Thermoguttaceae bacterium]MDD4786909.1 hypothetical protein [Pirellulales bacterium]MDI9446293.1 hypothetical protein [Planctomycetota bacterium]NLZ00045.1 hypothetical protein [Pirellulaceae bacterium]